MGKSSTIVSSFKICVQVTRERSNLKRGPKSRGHLLIVPTPPQGTHNFYGSPRAKSSCPSCPGDHSQEVVHSRETSAFSLTASQDGKFCPACFSEWKGVTMCLAHELLLFRHIL